MPKLRTDSKDGDLDAYPMKHQKMAEWHKYPLRNMSLDGHPVENMNALPSQLKQHTSKHASKYEAPLTRRRAQANESPKPKIMTIEPESSQQHSDKQYDNFRKNLKYLENNELQKSNTNYDLLLEETSIQRIKTQMDHSLNHKAMKNQCSRKELTNYEKELLQLKKMQVGSKIIYHEVLPLES